MRPPSNDPLAPAAEPVSRSRAERHRIEICRGDFCPRCGSSQTRPWGGFAGRRRYRCGGCGRTFSTFTGTAVRYLKRLDRWPVFLEAMDRRDSVRRSAERLGVDPSTAFRWRHRMLDEWHRRDQTVLRGRVYLRSVFLAHSEKGRRPATRKPRRRPYRYPSRIPSELMVRVALAWERDTATGAWVSPAGRTGLLWVTAIVAEKLGAVEEVITGEPLLRLPPPSCGSRPRITSCGVHELARNRVINLDRALRQWLRPLRGVATRYLQGYLHWFRWDLARPEAGSTTTPPVPVLNSSREQKPRSPPDEVARGGP